MGKVKSIMGFPMNECAICASPYVQIHHCIHGTANRKLSDTYRLTIPLCQEHHTGQNGVHFNKDLDNGLKTLAQIKFEEKCGSREDFIRIFGKSFI